MKYHLLYLINYYNTLIQPSKEDNNIFENIEENNLQKYNLNIIDPITGLNVAKSTFKIEEIKKAFKEGLDIIFSNLYKILVYLYLKDFIQI